jgi:phosphonate metabolism protein (transferase hexapeptide repeat family)
LLFDSETLWTAGNDRPYKKLGEKPAVDASATIRNCKLGSWTDIGPRVSLAETEVGDYTYFAGDASVIYARIGKFCSIASHVRINPGNHPVQRVTQHHCTYRRVQYGLDTRDDHDFFHWRRTDRVEIGHDVWLGHGVLVLAGVAIGTGAAVGAGAVVTKDIPPYAIAVGVPAQVIKYRFDADTVAQIMNTRWWDWDRRTLEERFNDLLDPEAFLQKSGADAPEGVK